MTTETQLAVTGSVSLVCLIGLLRSVLGPSSTPVIVITLCAVLVALIAFKLYQEKHTK